MDYSLCILSVVVFIEKRVRDSIDLRLLESDTGFSYRHLRELFRECTSMSLARYALSRRVAHAAFDIMHTGKSLTDIAGEYGFENAGGQAAFGAWAGAIGNDRKIPDNAVLPLLFERTMCQTDAQTMVGEGRSHASCWLHKVGDKYPEISDLCLKAAQQFRDAAECTLEMYKIKGGFEQNEQNIRTLARPDIRKQIVTLIKKAKFHDHEACGYIHNMLDRIS